MRNLAAAPVFATQVPVPDDGDWVTADAAGASDGPNNPAEQGLLNKIWSLVKGTVTLESLTIDGGNPGAPQVSTPGLIATTGNILALGLIQAGDVISSGVEFFISTAAARVGVTPKGVSWTAITPLDPDGPNPPRDQAITNQARALNTCKAWAVIRTADGGYPGYFVDGINMAGGSIVVAGGPVSTFTFNLASAMASANFLALPLIRNVATGAFVGWSKLTRTASTVVVEANVDFGATNLEIELLVFGRQN